MKELRDGTRFILVASPSDFTNNEWKQRMGNDFVPPPPVHNDYALMKVLFMLRSIAGRKDKKTVKVNLFKYEQPLTPINFSGLKDTDIIFIVGHGDPSGLYALGPDSSKNTLRLVELLTKDGGLITKRKDKKIIILLLSCRAGLGLHKGLSRKLSSALGRDVTVGGAQGFTFGSIRTSYLAQNEVLIRGIPWFMEYEKSIRKNEAENETSAREGKTITIDGKKNEINAFMDVKKAIEKEMKELIAKLQSTEVNNALDEIDKKFRSNWLSLLQTQFEHYALAKKRSNLEFDMWFDLITDGYVWTNGNLTTDQAVDAHLTGDVKPSDAGLSSIR
jgi:hypothetical protein